MRTTRTGLKAAFEGSGYRIFGAVVFAASLTFYLMALPSSFTGGRIGITAMRYLNAELIVFSIVMAALVGVLLPLIAFQIRSGQGAARSTAAGGVTVSVAAPILCCSPVLPIALGFAAALFPSVAGWGLQGFIATHQRELFSLAVVLLLIAVYQNACGVARGPSCALPVQAPRPGSDTATIETQR